MADPSRRRQVLEVVLRRLQRITKLNDFATDAGKHAFLGLAPKLGPDDATTAIVILAGDDKINGQQTQVNYHLPIDIQALATTESTERDYQPWLTVEAVLQDIKRAMELTQEPELEKTLPADLRFAQATADGGAGKLLAGKLERGQTITLDREAGMTVVGAQITYVAPLVERWGEP